MATFIQGLTKTLELIAKIFYYKTCLIRKELGRFKIPKHYLI